MRWGDTDLAALQQGWKIDGIIVNWTMCCTFRVLRHSCSLLWRLSLFWTLWRFLWNGFSLWIHTTKNRQSMTASVAYCVCYCSITYNSVFNCLGAETTTLEISHKLKISAIMLCDEGNKYILAKNLKWTKRIRTKLQCQYFDSRVLHYSSLDKMKHQKLWFITTWEHLSTIILTNSERNKYLALSVEISCSPKRLLAFLKRSFATRRL